MLKKWMISSILFLLAFPALPLYAGESPHSLDANFKISYHNYTEDTPDPLKSDEEGILPGLNLAYNYRGKKEFPLYGRLLFEYKQGDTDYNGTTQLGTPVDDTTANKFFGGEANIGFTVYPGKGNFPVSTTLYTGVGYRYWKRELGGPSPYSEEYAWFYFPLGLIVSYPITERWTGEVEIAAWFIYDPEVKVNLSGVNPNYSSPKLELGNRVGLKIALPFNYRFSPRWSLNLFPSYEYYSFGGSNPATITYVPVPLSVKYPGSDTHIFSLNAGLKFHF
jgi:hypothetical protein